MTKPTTTKTRASRRGGTWTRAQVITVVTGLACIAIKLKMGWQTPVTDGGGFLFAVAAIGFGAALVARKDVSRRWRRLPRAVRRAAVLLYVGEVLALVKLPLQGAVFLGLTGLLLALALMVVAYTPATKQQAQAEAPQPTGEPGPAETEPGNPEPEETAAEEPRRVTL